MSEKASRHWIDWVGPLAVVLGVIGFVLSGHMFIALGILIVGGAILVSRAIGRPRPPSDVEGG